MDRNLFQEEIQKLIEHYNITNIDEFKNSLYLIYNTVNKREQTEEVHSHIRIVLKSLFFNPAINDILIPGGFLDSPIGIIIFQAKYGFAERNYTVSQLSKIIGISIPRVYQLFKEDKIKPEKQGKVTLVRETELDKYLISQGIPLTNKNK